jgi:hypothetical protein
MLDDRLNGLHIPDRYPSERGRGGRVVLERGMPGARVYRLMAADQARKRD